MSELIENQSPRILIVDDSLSDILVMQKALAGLGQIYSAATGRQALEQLELVRPQVVLLDIEMPDMNGLEICQVIRDNPDLASTRVIFATVHEDDHTEYLSFKSGADDYLVKPYNMSICRFRVQNQIGLYHATRQAKIMLSMLDALPFAVSAWHRDGQCLTANQRFLDTFDFPSTHLKSLSLQTLLGTDMAERLSSQAGTKDKCFAFAAETGSIRSLEGYAEFSSVDANEEILVLTITSVDYQPTL